VNESSFIGNLAVIVHLHLTVMQTDGTYELLGNFQAHLSLPERVHAGDQATAVLSVF